jgi:hypothetical protein
MPADSTLDQPLETVPALAKGPEPRLQPDPVRVDDEFVRGWYDSSFELRRGLWVIETDLDPAVTHGIVVRKCGRRSRAP